MTATENMPKQRKRKIISIIFLSIFIIISLIYLLQIDIIKNLFGFENNIEFDFFKLMKIIVIIIGAIASLVGFIWFLNYIYKKIPIKGELINSYELIQKKKFFPQFRSTLLIKIKGLPRKSISDIHNVNYDSELLYLKNWDIIASISKICDEISFWVIKNNNRIQLFFSISSWSWFSKNKARLKAKNSMSSLISSFNNLYPSIQFEKTNLKDSQILLNTINDCTYGVKSKGIPALKNNQVQIDRLINTMNSINEECFYVVSFSGVKKGFERNNTLRIKNNEDKGELDEDLLNAKKTGQSKVGVYAFSQSEKGMYNLFAALLSIWSGTHTYNVEKIGDCSTKSIYKTLQKLDPVKYYRLSNKSLSSFLHLPEKPFFTEDTGQPIFEIPSDKENNENKNIILGNIIQNDKILDEFSLPLGNFLFNTEIVGMIGRGKSYMVASIIEQLLQIPIGCLIFDLKGEYSTFFAGEQNVMIYTIGKPAPLGINLFDIASNDEAQNILSLISEMLSIAGTPFSPTMLNIFEAALQKIIKRQDKNLEIFMSCLKESADEYTQSMKTSYSRDSIDAILNRLNYIFGGVNYEVFGAIENTLDLSYLDENKKIILDLSEYFRRGASTAHLFLVCNLILHLLSKYASNKGITNELRYLVILEEAMYLIPKRYNLESSASLGYSEQNFIVGRSLGIGTITIYQLWDSVSSVVHANSLTKILFRGEDTEKIRQSIYLNEDQYNYLSLLPDRNYILKSKSLSGPALLKTKNFEKKPITKDKYIKLAEMKYDEYCNPYRSLDKSLIELRKIIFEGISNSNQEPIVQNNKDIANFSEETKVT